MIKSVLIFNINTELIIQKYYDGKINPSDVINTVKSNSDLNFCEYGQLTLIYKKFDELITVFVVLDENEMYILSLINLMMNAMDKLLGGLHHKSFVYNFKDVSFAIDNFILNGKVINLDPMDISISPHYLKPFTREE